MTGRPPRSPSGASKHRLTVRFTDEGGRQGGDVVSADQRLPSGCLPILPAMPTGAPVSHHSKEAALRAIAEMRVDANTDHAQLSALLIAIAKAAL